MKNIKLFLLSFFFFFFCFSIFPLFLLSSPSSVFSLSPDVPKKKRTYHSVHWKVNQKPIPASLLPSMTTDVFVPIFLGLKELEVESHTYYFDKIVPALYEQFQEQQKPFHNIDFTLLSGEAKQQIWQFFEQKSDENEINEGIGYNTKLHENIKKKLKTYLNSALNSVKPLLLKMEALNIKTWSPSWSNTDSLDFSSHWILGNPNFVLIKPKNTGYFSGIQERLELRNFILNSDSFDSSVSFITRTINLVTNPWLHILQETKGLDFTHLVVGKERVDVSSLVNSKVKQVSELSISDLKIIGKLKTIISNFLGINTDEQNKKTNLTKTLNKLESIVQSFIKTKLETALTKIRDTLKDFANTKIKKIQIQGINYQVDVLLQKAKNQLVDSSKNTKDQLLPLVRAKISPETLKNALLESYYSTIVQNLNALQNENVFEFQINDKTYFLTELNKQINKNKNFLSFNAKTKTELMILAKNGITKTQLDNVSTEVSKVKTDNKKLMIGLSVGGGIVVFPSFAWFLYWLFKPRK